MQYFKITQNTDSKIIGKYPQVKDLKINFHEARASQWGKIDEWKTEDDLPDLNNFILHNNSRLSDCISNNYVSTTDGLFISEKCHQILESFRINGSFHPMTIFRRETPHQYSFLWYEYGAKSKIDFNKSIFIEFNINTLEFGNTSTAENFEEYKKKVEQVREAKGDELAVWNLFPKLIHFNERYDLTPMFKYGLICNEKVKNAIEENKLTGFDFRPIDVEIVFEK